MANEALRLIGSSTGRGAEQRGDELDLRELWRAILRRKFVLLTTIIAITGATYAFISQQTPMYTAQALIQIKTRDAQIIQVAGVVDELIADPATILSEIQFLTSPAFLRRMVEQLDLMEDPEFNGALREDAGQPSVLELLNPMRYVPESWLSSLTVERESAAPAVDPAMLQLNRVVGSFGSRLLIEPVGMSYIVALSFMAEDPAKAAMIANAMADEY
ncbi:MAG: Wzz/FepE/Etk N-terminal domain-containing protein, partial [Geminicoccaceae bacterium]